MTDEFCTTPYFAADEWDSNISPKLNPTLDINQKLQHRHDVIKLIL